MIPVILISEERCVDGHTIARQRLLERSQDQPAGSDFLGVSQGTIRRALADLAARGLLEKRQARCTIVKKLSGLSGFFNLAVFLPDYSSPNAARFLGQLNGAKCKVTRGRG